MKNKVLIVEDNDFLLSMFTAKLKNETDWEIFTAIDGQEAINLCRKENPQLMFLDIMLPNMNGFKVLEEIRSDESFDKMYIIVLSALGQEKDIKQAKDLGANDYIVKSEMNMDKILERAVNALSDQ